MPQKKLTIERKGAPIESPDSFAQHSAAQLPSQSVQCNSNWLAKYTANKGPRRILRAYMSYWQPGQTSLKSAQPPRQLRNRESNSYSSQNNMAKFRTQHERKTPLKAYADHRGPRTSKKLLGEEVRSHIKEFTRKIRGDKKVKHKRHDFHPPGQRCFIL